MNALLFDIDGTLLNSHGLGRTAFEEALSIVMGVNADLSAVDWLGRTDCEIVTEVLVRSGFKRSVARKRLPEVFRCFTGLFDSYSKKQAGRFVLLEYVREFLEAVKDCPVGLLTGNARDTAYIKLRMTGIDGYFPGGVGGFGDERCVRSRLYPLAVRRMKKHFGERRFDSVFVIGDSHRDIECAKANGAVSVAVATGRQSLEELRSYEPDFAFRNFSEMREILDTVRKE